MGGMNFDISAFSPKLISAIVYTVGALFAFALFPTFNGAAQGWHLEARQGGACETRDGTRFDRLIEKAVAGTGTGFVGRVGEESDPNKYNWDNGATVSRSGTTTACIVTLTGLAANDRVLTADGTEIGWPVATAVATTGNTVAWTQPASMFNDNRAIINIIIGATILLIGVGPIMILGGIGIYLLNTFAGGMSGVSKFLIGTLGAIVAVTLLGSFTDFISIAYDAVDANRYSMYEHSIASLAGTIRQFWGLIFAAGWVGLGGYFGWQAFQKYRESRSGGVGRGSGSQVLG